MPKTLIVDPMRCDGCRACEVACSMVKEGEANLSKARIRTVRFPEEHFFFPLVCCQCETPSCLRVCPSGALRKEAATGTVLLDRDRCIGCKMCLVACPFGAIVLADGLAAKCDLCDGDPVCVRLCEPQAIFFGDAAELAALRQYVIGDAARRMLLVRHDDAARRA